MWFVVKYAFTVEDIKEAGYKKLSTQEIFIHD